MGSTRVRFVRRAEWHAKPPGPMHRRAHPFVGVTVHQTTGATFGPPDVLDDWVRAIQAFHMGGQHEHTVYADIAYNALFTYSGLIFEGRANWAVGAHARSNGNVANETHLGIAYLGDGAQLTDAARDALRAYVYVATIEARRPLVVTGHSDWHAHGGIATACPHDPLHTFARSLSRG